MRPLIAQYCDNLKTLRFPLFATPRIRGERCLVTAEGAIRENLKPIPNDFIRGWIEHLCPVGFDGYIVVTDEEGQWFDEIETCRAVLAKDGQPYFLYLVSDYVPNWKLTGPSYTWDSFGIRSFHLRKAMEKIKDPQIVMAPFKNCFSIADLMAFSEENEYGPALMTRNAFGTYKFGESDKAQLLVELDHPWGNRAKINDLFELKGRLTDLSLDGYGFPKGTPVRDSVSKSGLLGGVNVTDLDGNTFDLVFGFGMEQRKVLWDEWGDQLKSLFVHFSYQWVDDRMAFPVFIGFE